MASKIYKYEITGTCMRVDLPRGSEWLSVGFQPPTMTDAKLCAWARIPEPEPAGAHEHWHLHVELTGRPFTMPERAQFLGTVVRVDEIVLHVYAVRVA